MLDLYIYIRYCLLQTACSVRNNYIVDLRLVTILGSELSLDGSHEVIVELLLDKVDGATADAATHNA